MGHPLKLNKSTIVKVGNLLPRLKHAVEPIKLINWLENFDESEVDLAIDLLSVYEYIPFNEFMFRLNDLLRELFRKIPRGEKIIIFPYGKVGKSGTLVTYPLKNTTVFEGRKKDILLTHDYENIKNPKEYKHFIFLDDFIGSGKTFCKVYSEENNIQNWIQNQEIENVFILATIVMAEGKKYINKRFKDVIIIAEERNKIFDTNLSPLKIFGNLSDIKNVTKKHGDNIRVGRFPAYAPFGFDNSQSLISYFHCTPNNTLPIIWGEQKDYWKPLFPRKANIRMNEAREFKKEIAFYIGICNRLAIDLYTGKSILEEKKDKLVRNRTHNTKQDHSVIALLFLKNQGYNDLIICHILGLTNKELRQIYKEAKDLGFVNTRKSITQEGVLFLKKLKEKTKKENFRKETKYSLRMRQEYELYIPKQFNGMT
ncbi:MAG: hypothetical protein HWD89_13870 [Tenacibaculum sp.]|uniref:phosphoribosyltransferase-like protein n=1 Tax=Tenacibaculum sp. TaxID=1906242 RepID=UPI00182E6291|nr:hypothetical protein [Tenacibaculum sp.]NVK10137.1 hypothetical protein [Tenacibaculum sp.]